MNQKEFNGPIDKYVNWECLSYLTGLKRTTCENKIRNIKKGLKTQQFRGLILASILAKDLGIKTEVILQADEIIKKDTSNN